MTIARVFALALLWAAWGTASAQIMRNIEIGDRDFAIADPAGFSALSFYQSATADVFKAAVPADIELIETYVTHDDLQRLQGGSAPAMERSIHLQVMRASQDKILSADGFTELAKDFEAALPRQAGFNGVTGREPWALYYGMSIAGAEPMEVAGALVVANYQLMNLLAYVDAATPNAKSIAQQNVQSFAKAVRASNPDAQWLAERAGPLDLPLGGDASSSGGRPEESGAYKLGYWFGIGLFIFIVYRLFNRK